MGGAAVAELAFNSELRYLLVVLASDTRKALESLQPDMGKLKALAPPPDTLLGYILTTVTGALQQLCQVERVASLRTAGHDGDPV